MIKSRFAGNEPFALQFRV